MQTVLPSASAAAALSRDLDAALADEADETAPRACIPHTRCDSIDATRAAVTLQHVALSRPPVVLCATFQPTTRGRPNFLLKQTSSDRKRRAESAKPPAEPDLSKPTVLVLPVVSVPSTGFSQWQSRRR